MTEGGRGGFDESWRNRIEAKLYELERAQWTDSARIASLETTRDNEQTRRSSTPARVFAAISAAVAVASFLFNLYLAGLRP